MKQIPTIALLLFLCTGAVMGQSFLKIASVGDEPMGFDSLFSKRVGVFGITIFATRETPNEKVLHAANVLAQYLDNDSDGLPDNKLVIQAIRKSGGAVVMHATERAAEAVDVHRYIPERVWDGMSILGLYGEETHPGGAARGIFDVTYEEILHLITSAGYANAYPDVFGEKPGTAIAEAMDKARGGHFRKVPREYPKGAWYTYDDRSCDYACQITEYIYWGLTSILGAQDFPGRFEDISEEWRFNTAAKVEHGDPSLHKLLTDPKYAFPTKLPDGQYNPRMPVAPRQGPDTSRPGPWDHDLCILKSTDGLHFGRRQQFVAGGGVASVVRDAKGRLIAAFQWFPRQKREDFDRVAVKVSTNEGKTWTDPQTIKLEGMPGDYLRPCDPTLVLLDDGRIRMYFTSDRRGGRTPRPSAGTYSAVSSDGVHYAFEPGVRFAVAGKAVLDCAVARLGKTWHYYAPVPGYSGGAYHAVSNDGLEFTRKADVVIPGDRQWLGCVAPTRRGLRFYGSGGRGGWCATSDDGFSWQLARDSLRAAMDPGVVRTKDGQYLMIGTCELRSGPAHGRPFVNPDKVRRAPPEHRRESNSYAPRPSSSSKYRSYMLNYDQSKLPHHKANIFDEPRLVEIGCLIDLAGDEAWRDHHSGRGGDFCRVLFMNDTFYAFLTDHPPGPDNIYYVRGFDRNWQFTGFERRLTPPGESDIDQDIAFDGEYVYEYAMQSRSGKIRKFDKAFNLVKQTPVFHAGKNEVILDQNIECYGGKIYAGSEYRENNALWRHWQRQGGSQNIPPNTEVARATHLRVFDTDLNLFEEEDLIADIGGAAVANQYWAIGASQFHADGYHCVAAVSAIGNISYFDRGASIGARQLFILKFDEDLNFADFKSPLTDTSTSNSWCTGSLYENGRYYIVYCSRRPGEGHQYGPAGPPPGTRARGLPGMGHVMLGIFDRNFNELETVLVTTAGGNRPQLLKVGNKLYVT